MKLFFQEEDIKQGLNRVEIPDEELVLEGEFIEGENKQYKITGVATIEGERYHQFEVVFSLLEEPAEMTIAAIMSADWDWYDFTF